jgi:hypothetical protein
LAKLAVGDLPGVRPREEQGLQQEEAEEQDQVIPEGEACARSEIFERGLAAAFGP